MKKTKIAVALMIITAGSALIGAGTASAEEVKASRYRHSPPPRREWREPPRYDRYMPPPRHEWREPPRHRRHMPPPRCRRY